MSVSFKCRLKNSVSYNNAPTCLWSISKPTCPCLTAMIQQLSPTNWKLNKVFAQPPTTSVSIYILKNYLHKLTYFSNVYYRMQFYSSALSDVTVTPTLEVCSSAMVSLLITGNQEVWSWSGFRWHKFSIGFVKIKLFKAQRNWNIRHTHTHTPWWCYVPTFLQ